MGDLDWMRKLKTLAQIDRDDQLPLRMAGLRHVRTELQEEERRRPGSQVPPVEFGKAAHLLQQFHQFYFRRHRSVQSCACYRSSRATTLQGKDKGKRRLAMLSDADFPPSSAR